MSYPATCLLGHRLNAYRLNYLDARLYINIGGAWAGDGQDMLVESLSVNDRLNEVPNTLTATVRGAKPAEGALVSIALGSQNANMPLFVGNILRTTRVWAANNPRHVLYHIEATDPTWRLNAVLVSARYRNQSASAIAADLLSKAPAGFTSAIEPNLPVLDEITFTNVTIMQAFAQLATRIGGYTLCDYQSRVYLFTTPTTMSAPAPLIASHKSLASVTYVRDLTQIITRAVVEGGGANALANCGLGETIIPVESAEWYSASGGIVVSGPQRLTYTGRLLGGGGTLVGPGAAPSATPIATLVAAAAGVTDGAHDYAVTFMTASGESARSPLASVTVGALPAPVQPPIAGTPTSGGAVTPGGHYYAVSFVTATGETLTSPLGNLVTTYQTAPVPPPTHNISAYVDWGGSLDYESWYSYGVSFTTGINRETPVVYGGADFYVPAFVEDINHPMGWSLRVHNIPTSTDPRVTGRRLYRTEGNGSTLKFLRELNNSVTEFDDTFGDFVLGAPAPSVDTTSQAFLTVPLTIPLGGAGVTARKIYRTTANTGILKLVATLADNTTTTYTDTKADAALGADAPIANTALMRQVDLSGIQVGAAAVTARKVYRTPTGSSQLKFLGTIPDNVTTTATDVSADAALGANIPTGDTSGLTQPAGQVLPGSTSLIVAGTGGFPSTGGWAVVGNGQAIRFTGVSGTALTGIPAAGPGAILASVGYNSTVSAAPCIVGVPVAGAGAILYPIVQGDPVNVRVEVDDAAAQAALAALIGGTGVRESLLQDGRISITQALARGRALLEAHKTVLETFAHRSRDPLTRSGATVNVNLPPPTDIVGSFRLQDVTIASFNPRAIVMPTFDARSSSQRFTFEDLLRRMTNTNPPPATGEDR